MLGKQLHYSLTGEARIKRSEMDGTYKILISSSVAKFLYLIKKHLFSSGKKLPI